MSTDDFVSKIKSITKNVTPADQFQFALEHPEPDVKYLLLTGLRPLDRLSGCVQFGRITDLFGYKSSELVKHIKEAFHSNCVYEIINRSGFDFDLKEVYVNKFMLFAPTTPKKPEELFALVFKFIDQVAAEKANALTIGDRVFAMIVIDGFNWRSDRAGAARQRSLLVEGFRELIHEVARNHIAVVLTSGGDCTPIAYYATHRIELKLLTNADYSVIRFTVIKNRLRKPLRVGALALQRDGTFSDCFSLLETMVLYKAAIRRQNYIHFDFKDYGIKPTTFDRSDFQRTRPGQIIFQGDDWPAYYQKHKEDFDKLFEAVLAPAFSLDGVPYFDGPDD